MTDNVPLDPALTTGPKPTIKAPVMSTKVGNDHVKQDPALKAAQPPPPPPPPPAGRIATSWQTQKDQNGAMITGKLFGLNGPFEYEGHGTDVTASDGSGAVGPEAVTIKPDTDTMTAAAAIIRREENDGYRQTGAEWDVNAYRGGYGSDTITKADGTVVKITKGMVIDKADAERDLQRRIPILASKAASRVGLDAWNKLPGPVQGVLIGMTDNYGTLYSDIASAAKSGNLNTLANAIEARGHMPGIQNTARRKREADIVRSVARAQQQVA